MKFFKTQQARERTFSTLFIVVVCILLVAFIFKFEQFARFLGTVSQALLPVWVAFALAFIVIEPIKKLDDILSRLLCRKKNRKKLVRALSILVCYISLIFIVVAFVLLIVPRLIDSIKTLSVSVSWFYQTYAQDVIAFLEEHNIAGPDAKNVLITWEQLMSTALDMAGRVFKGAASASVSITSYLVQVLLGLAMSIYMLFDKERLSAQCKKAMYALSSVRVTNELIFWTRKAESIFSGYIAGKLLESLIVGLITYIPMLCFRMEYAELISVVVALTNIVPIIGPWVGAIIGTSILLIVNPMHGLWFLILIIVVQQLDANLLGPRILGNSTGISSFWTIMALTIGGGFYGVAGMFLSIPIFAIAYALIKTFCNVRLKNKSLPTDLSVYKEQGVVITEEKRE